jgi:hypothetical protein
MGDCYNNRGWPFYDDRIAQTQFTHSVECGVQPFADVLVRWIRKLIDESHEPLIPGVLRVQDVFVVT